MEDLLKKLSRYTLANYLIPGTIYVFVICYHTGKTDIIENTVLFLFVAYFCGVVISRIGSLVVKTVIGRFQNKPEHSYEDYVAAEQKDLKLEPLVEDQNLYRSMISLIILMYLSIRYLDLRNLYPWIKYFELEIGALALALLFIASFLKQDYYINERVKHNKKSD